MSRIETKWNKDCLSRRSWVLLSGRHGARKFRFVQPLWEFTIAELWRWTRWDWSFKRKSLTRKYSNMHRATNGKMQIVTNKRQHAQGGPFFPQCRPSSCHLLRSACLSSWAWSMPAPRLVDWSSWTRCRANPSPNGTATFQLECVQEQPLCQNLQKVVQCKRPPPARPGRGKVPHCKGSYSPSSLGDCATHPLHALHCWNCPNEHLQGTYSKWHPTPSQYWWHWLCCWPQDWKEILDWTNIPGKLLSNI